MRDSTNGLKGALADMSAALTASATSGRTELIGALLDIKSQGIDALKRVP